MSDGQPLIPPVLYLPTVDDGQRGQIRVALRETLDGRIALLAYTALDRLGTHCGPDQGWTLIETSKLDDLGITFDVIYLDLDIPEEHRSRKAAS